MEVNRVTYAPPPPLPTPVAAPAEPAPAPVEILSAPMPVPPPVPANEAEAPERTGQRLERAVTELNRSLSPYQRHMSIGHHEAANRTMVTVYNTETNEVIREIPPERVLDAHASLLEMAGLLMDRRG